MCVGEDWHILNSDGVIKLELPLVHQTVLAIKDFS
jgi:hypothetical protein